MASKGGVKPREEVRAHMPTLEVFTEEVVFPSQPLPPPPPPAGPVAATAAARGVLAPLIISTLSPSDPDASAVSTSSPDALRSPQQTGGGGGDKVGGSDLIVHHDYHDYSRIYGSDLVERLASLPHPPHSRGQRIDTCFPSLLHRMLNDVEALGLSDAVSWSPHGRAFAVHNPRIFAERVLPLFFRQTRYTSFQRQLNLYGYLRLSRGDDAGGYYHELFLRGRPELVARMRRTKVKGTFKKPKRNPEEEPDFANMPTIGLLRGNFEATSSILTGAAESVAILRNDNTRGDGCPDNHHRGDGRKDSGEASPGSRQQVLPFSVSPFLMEVAAINNMISRKKARANNAFGGTSLSPTSYHMLPPRNRAELSLSSTGQASVPIDQPPPSPTLSSPSPYAVPFAVSAVAAASQEMQCQPRRYRVPTEKTGTMVDAGANLNTISSSTLAPSLSSLPVVPLRREDVLSDPAQMSAPWSQWISAHQPGNVRLRHAVRLWGPSFRMASTEADRDCIAARVVDSIVKGGERGVIGPNPPGRFLRRVAVGGGRSRGVATTAEDGERCMYAWEELNGVEARSVVRRALLLELCSVPSLEPKSTAEYSSGADSSSSSSSSPSEPVARSPHLQWTETDVGVARKLVMLAEDSTGTVPEKVEAVAARGGGEYLPLMEEGIGEGIPLGQSTPRSSEGEPPAGEKSPPQPEIMETLPPHLGASKPLAAGAVSGCGGLSISAKPPPLLEPPDRNGDDRTVNVDDSVSLNASPPTINPIGQDRGQAVRDWLSGAVPYLQQDDVRRYSLHLVEDGFDSAEILNDHLLEVDLGFMKTAHRRALVAAKITRRKV